MYVPLVAGADGGNPLRLAGIAHVALRVSDLAAARAFYEKLGFEQAFEFNKDNRVSESFIKVNDRQFVELYPQKDGSQALGLMHVCYESGDLQALHDEYVKRGLTPSQVKKAGAGNLLFVLHGPENELIEFTQYMPESMHSQDRGKHLGSDRIADTLAGGAPISKVPEEERALFLDHLGFKSLTEGHCVRLLLPGDSGQEVDFGCETGGKPRVIFTVTDITTAAAKLRSRDLEIKVSDTGVVTTDPDGNEVLFRRAEGR
jgi:catechol 2,3-dioxygenase-like lactoylglutathione lyase family enzyme